MKLRKVMAWTLASAMFAGLLAGCGGSTQTTETAAAESGSEEGGSSAEGGKVLRYQASTLVDSLDPGTFQRLHIQWCYLPVYDGSDDQG